VSFRVFREICGFQRHPTAESRLDACENLSVIEKASGSMLLYTFTAYSSIYDLYVAILGGVITIAIVLSVFVSLDRLWHVLKCFAYLVKAKLTGRKPEDAFTPQPLPDPVYEGHLFPRVAVQLPMFNERAVCQAVIDSASEMVWPRSRFTVQVISLPYSSCDLNHASFSLQLLQLFYCLKAVQQLASLGWYLKAYFALVTTYQSAEVSRLAYACAHHELL